MTENYEQRALAAYFKSGGVHILNPGEVDVIDHLGRRYVLLSNINGTLAVYRILEKQDRLKRLKRWPKEVAA